MTEIQHENIEESNADKLNPIDQFITDGESDKAFQDVFGLPESVKRSLEEVS